MTTSINAYQNDNFDGTNKVVETIAQWLRGQYGFRDNDANKLKHNIRVVRGFKGGWEKWLQVELALFLEATAVGYTVRAGREVAMYKKTGFVDL